MKPGIENAIHVLQRDLIEDHPDDAVLLLERLPPAEIADVLTRHADHTSLGGQPGLCGGARVLA